MVLRVVENEIASYNFPEQPTVSVLLYTFEQAIRDWHGRRLVVTEAQMLCINQAALEAYWICDLVLRLQLPDQLFVRFFKTRQHEDAIKGKFPTRSSPSIEAKTSERLLQTDSRVPLPLHLQNWRWLAAKAWPHSQPTRTQLACCKYSHPFHSNHTPMLTTFSAKRLPMILHAVPAQRPATQ